jgi:polyisoprenoid-binding protein YceI
MRLLAASLLLVSGLAQAADYTALPGSTLSFTASFQGKAIEGDFKRFSPQIRFDPAHLDQSRFDVGIELVSAGTGDGERDEMLQSGDFFNTRALPQARFSASKFRALGGNRYAADGQLSLRGVSKPVTLSFTWTAGAKPVLVGDAGLKRSMFGVGAGDWADTSELADGVKVHTRLVLGPKAK